jgi:hypothetical protein
MKMCFPSDMPLHEQLRLSGERRRVGRKHTKTIGPGRQREQPSRDLKTKAAWRKYKEQVALYFRGLRDTMPARPDAKEPS